MTQTKRIEWENVVMWAFAVLSAPIWGPWHLYSNWKYSGEIRKIVSGSKAEALKRMVDIWSECTCFYASLVGPDGESRIENDALEAFIKKHPDSEKELLLLLEDKNPYVVAYSFRTLCRLHEEKLDYLNTSTLPAGLMERSDSITKQFGCIREEVELGKRIQEILTNHITRSNSA